MKTVKKLILLSCLAGLMTGCGHMDGLAQSPFGSDSFSEIDGVFGILSDEEAAKLADASEEDKAVFFSKRLEALKEKYPDIAEKIAAFQALSPEERQAQMQDMKGRFGMMRPGGFGEGSAHRGMAKPIHKPMGMAHGFHAPNAERMAAFKENHPELAENFAGPHPAGVPGMRHGHHMHPPMPAFMGSPEERLAALKEKNPEWAAKPPRPQWPGMKRRFQDETSE